MAHHQQYRLLITKTKKFKLYVQLLENEHRERDILEVIVKTGEVEDEIVVRCRQPTEKSEMIMIRTCATNSMENINQKAEHMQCFIILL